MYKCMCVNVKANANVCVCVYGRACVRVTMCMHIDKMCLGSCACTYSLAHVYLSAFCPLYYQHLHMKRVWVPFPCISPPVALWK